MASRLDALVCNGHINGMKLLSTRKIKELSLIFIERQSRRQEECTQESFTNIFGTLTRKKGSYRRTTLTDILESFMGIASESIIS